MALYSRNPGPWRTARTGALPAFNYSGKPMGKPIDGALDLALVSHSHGSRRKRFKPPVVEAPRYIRPKHRHGRNSA